MKTSTVAPLLFSAFALTACAAGPSLQERRLSAADAIDALQRADFPGAATEADTVLTLDPGNPYAALVRAAAGYKKALHDLFLDVQANVTATFMGRGLNDRYIRFALDSADKAFAAVDADLAVAAAEPEVDLTLCPACWEYDWNRNGRIDSRDRRFLEIERDADGVKIPKDDPRRRPTYRFDYGDVLWARAFMAFHRAAINLIAAFDFARLADELITRHPESITLSPIYPEKIAAAKTLILQGLDFSDKSREAYLAETDDDREWLPNPRQKSHPMPLPVDDALYDTWRHVIIDARKIVTGEEGIHLAEAAQLGDIQWDNPPKGYLNIGKFLDAPQPIVLRKDDVDEIDHHGGDVNGALGRLIGPYIEPDMKPTFLLKRMDRMKTEILQGRDSAERKLRYLIWIN